MMCVCGKVRSTRITSSNQKIYLESIKIFIKINKITSLCGFFYKVRMHI